MPIWMTCLGYEAKRFPSLTLPLAVLVRLDCVVHMTHRFEEFRVTGRIESQASVGMANKG